MGYKLPDRWKSVSPQRLKEIVENSKTMLEIQKKLGYVGGGFDRASLEAKVQYLERIGLLSISTQHLDEHSRGDLEKVLRWYSVEEKKNRVSSANLRYYMKIAGVIEQCAECGISDWLDKPLVLDIDHVDGEFLNCTKENLRFLCANCHKQQPTSSQSSNSVWVAYFETLEAHGITSVFARVKMDLPPRAAGKVARIVNAFNAAFPGRVLLSQLDDEENASLNRILVADMRANSDGTSHQDLSRALRAIYEAEADLTATLNIDELTRRAERRVSSSLSRSICGDHFREDGLF